jgi:hypothetical protein
MHWHEAARSKNKTDIYLGNVSGILYLEAEDFLMGKGLYKGWEVKASREGSSDLNQD